MRPRCRRAALPHLVIAAAATLAAVTGAATVCRAGALPEPTSAGFSIYDASTDQPIGQGTYAITREGDADTLVVRSRYWDGAYEVETEKLTSAPSGAAVLLHYEHAFFALDGSKQRLATADISSGRAACVTYGHDGANLTATLHFPPDIYAGASVLVPVRDRLSHRRDDPFTLHVFNCSPDPEVLEIRVHAQPTPGPWSHYPGQLITVDLHPHLGWYDAVVSLFVPTTRFWFDPQDEWRFVGGEFARFYRGPEIEIAGTPSNHSLAAHPDSAVDPAEGAGAARH